MTAQQAQQLADVLQETRQKSSDRTIIRMMRVVIFGIGFVAIFFVVYVAALVVAGTHDAARDRRIDALEHRVQELEARRTPR